ncbi:winged helix-turn-helix transcriptional regulator [Sphingomonas kyeonggiensis]|uniref:DNA-binding HxlR family transcriptional regulator n=1 Tax=Sphingomonas kyeonggiensis TaxID=1268553 RepID=A0A7W6JXI9_9SPHN|nr:winged helix-turn-helix transcriptional regulator [Sphingomonas kyeonggiensis]MBB4100307.1 DNA-binding HxlR family transcriptional regulator [Sphingomonas kyeonggiensis]
MESTPPSPAQLLRMLEANRWAIPVLALLSREQGSRFAVIARAFSLSHNSLTRCLAWLKECGWVVPNPGHGHPLRPEYLLSEAGRPVGALCERIEAMRTRLKLATGELPRWSLPLVGGMGTEWSRFGEIQARLAPVTPRALSTTLKAVIDAELVRRRLEDRYPPLPLYALTGKGQDLAGALTS